MQRVKEWNSLPLRHASAAHVHPGIWLGFDRDLSSLAPMKSVSANSRMNTSPVAALSHAVAHKAMGTFFMEPNPPVKADTVAVWPVSSKHTKFGPAHVVSACESKAHQSLEPSSLAPAALTMCLVGREQHLHLSVAKSSTPLLSACCSPNLDRLQGLANQLDCFLAAFFLGLWAPRPN